MPLDTIYLTRHGVGTPTLCYLYPCLYPHSQSSGNYPGVQLTQHQHRLNFTVDPQTGKYSSQFPTPTGNPADPILTSHGVQQSHELAAYLGSPGFQPKPFRIYSSPFYRCLQTIRPSVEALREQQQENKNRKESWRVEEGAVLDVRLENGVGEWFGPTSYFHHPSPPSPETLETHFPTLLNNDSHNHTPSLLPSTRGETIAQLHNRVATALQSLITDLDAEIAAYEAAQPQHEQKTSKAVLICSHAAPLIAMGRVLTGRMPDDSAEEDFNVFTAGLSTFLRRTPSATASATSEPTRTVEELLAPGTKALRPELRVPDWESGNGVAGGWDCVGNGDCSFLSGGAQRGWHFNGDESFDPPAAPALVQRVSATKL